MAAEVVPLEQLKLPAGPSPVTAEQKYWKSFKNQKSHTSTASWPVSHISFPAPTGSYTSTSSTSAVKNNDLFAVTAGPRVDVYSIRRREPLKTIGRFDAAARCGEIRPDGRVLLAGDDTGRMQVFDVAGSSRAAVLRTWNIHKQPVWVTKWSPRPADLTTLMSCSDDKTVRLWDLPSADPVRTFVGHQDYVRSGAFMTGPAGAGGGGNILVTGSYDSTVRLWDARVPGPAVLTFAHQAPIEAVLPLPSGTTILAASGNSISVLDVVHARPIRTLTNHQKTVTSLCLASNGRRVLSGGLDGHVKIYDAESGNWNVSASIKYPSPVLSVAVVTAGAAASDRHLAVGMASGLLSIRTRLTGAAADRARELEAARTATDIADLRSGDAAREKRKRNAAHSLALDKAGLSADFVIGDTAVTAKGGAATGGRKRRSAKEPRWQLDLRQQRYRQALDRVLDPASPEASRSAVLSCLTALRHRSALSHALEGRDEETVQPALQWACRHIVDPRYVSVCVDVGLHLLDQYAEFADRSPELERGFRNLRNQVVREVERAQMACQTGGMLETLLVSSES
ncbi:U3 small nucleolar RNA-associated protein 15 [Gaeumannomyces tritici R3-111a-1]|uniref:U3 small nucleolar RNA-associated protein 15 n=1 Tax=Gaeumannomyces tritici (strain R3-111a-1) TaxID=644352 RepID=J3NZF2_GAET3|nr:U3 small nucleolar RNA-associated protein 15 [Gaeumannomyces tritici R3-111a-1]EJT76735.1 U3 small nucleolar RNA-associated protein 15 [Gaeumannomyces tritici R3-111a-1]